MSTTEKTFHGYIETTRDSLIILEACRRGLLPRVSRRLQEKERQLVQSGAVFCFDENESGIKRWTDGLVWSPSRILGNFLVYRELDKRAPQSDNARTPCQNLSDRQRERALVGSLTNSYRFKKHGLIKKSMSIVVNGVQQHLISYYNKDDVLNDRLQTPSNIPALAALEISPELLLRQNFRIPLFLDVTPPPPQILQSSTPSSTPPPEKRRDDVIELNLERSLLRQKRRFLPMQQKPQTYRGNSISSVSSASSASSISSNMTPSPTTTAAPAPDGCICGRSKVAQQHQQQQQQQSCAPQPAPVQPPPQPAQQQPQRLPDDNPGDFPVSYGVGSSYAPMGRPASFVSGYHMDRQDQNPHQHLFYSTSLHAINHSAIPMRAEVISNAFMLDPNYLLGSGWNEFEMQL